MILNIIDIQTWIQIFFKRVLIVLFGVQIDYNVIKTVYYKHIQIESKNIIHHELESC